MQLNNGNIINYKYYKPHQDLLDLVKLYWVLDAEISEQFTFNIMPDGYFDILILFDNYSVSQVMLTGIWDLMLPVTYYSNIKILGIRFKPIALSSIYNYRIRELKNNSDTIELKDFSLNKQQIEDCFFNNKRELFNYLNKHFLELMKKAKINDKVYNIFEMIELSSGCEQIDSISVQTSISSRQINRIVNEYLGLNPKDYSRLVRFRDTISYMKKHNKDYIGYYDQSHFIKDFKRITGSTPLQLDLFNDVRFLQYYDFKNS